MHFDVSVKMMIQCHPSCTICVSLYPTALQIHGWVWQIPSTVVPLGGGGVHPLLGTHIELAYGPIRLSSWSGYVVMSGSLRHTHPGNAKPGSFEAGEGVAAMVGPTLAASTHL